MVVLSSVPFEKGGLQGWRHDEGHAYGFFHTFDAFKVKDEPPRKIHILLPHEYDHEDAASKRYPVIYMHDGQTTFWGGGFAGGSWHVAETLSKPELLNSLQKVIIVAIHPLDRAYEYTHATYYPNALKQKEEQQSEEAQEDVVDPEEAARKAAEWDKLFGGVAQYTEYLAARVKPWIDEHYRTVPGDGAVVGSSFGGIAAFYNALTRPDCFGIAGCLSTSLDVGLKNGHRDQLRDSKIVADTRATLKNPKRRPKLWFAWGLQPGEKEEAYRGDEMVKLLSNPAGEFQYVLGRDLFYLADPAGEHHESSWERQFAHFMRQFYSIPPAPPSQLQPDEVVEEVVEAEAAASRRTAEETIAATVVVEEEEEEKQQQQVVVVEEVSAASIPSQRQQQQQQKKKKKQEQGEQQGAAVAEAQLGQTEATQAVDAVAAAAAAATATPTLQPAQQQRQKPKKQQQQQQQQSKGKKATKKA